MQRIIITGVNGLVGSHLATHFANKYEVIGIHRLNADLSEISHLKIQFKTADVLDVLELDQIILEGDIVIHTAAMVSFSDNGKKTMFATNVDGTANVVNVCLTKNIKQFIHLSSVSALGRPSQNSTINDNKKWEDSPNNTDYAKTKFLAECEVWRGMAEGLPVSIIRPSVIIGEGDWNKSSSQLFKYVFDQKKYYSDGHINVIDVADIVIAVEKIINTQNHGEAFILSGHSLSYQSFFEAIARNFNVKAPHIKAKKWQAELLWRFEKIKSKLTGSEPLITKETARTAEIKIKYDASKYLDTFNTNFTPFEESMKRICSYYRLKIKTV